MDIDTQTENKCLLCGNTKLQFKKEYQLSELINLWEPIKFSQTTILAMEKQNQSTSLFYCPTCKLEMFLPQIIGNESFYKDLSTNPDAKYYEKDKWDFTEAINQVEKNKSIIEIGCGPGRFLEMAQKKGANVVGIEYNKDAIELARKKGLVIYDEKFDRELFYEKFDAAFSFHVLEHVNDPFEFIKNMCKMVRKGGLVCISVPNQDGPIKYIDPCIMNMPPHHASRWKLDTFRYIEKESGLKLIHFKNEPLLLRNRSYYTFHWLLTKVQKNKSILHQAVFYIFRMLFELFFGTFVLLGFKYLNLFKGQAVYVVYQKL